MQKPSPCTKPVKLQWLSFGLREISLRYLSALVSWEGFKHKVACIFPFSHSVVSLITLMLQAMGSLRMSNEMHSNNISLNIYLTTKFPRPQGPASSALWPHWLSVAVIKHRFHIVNKLQCFTAWPRKVIDGAAVRVLLALCWSGIQDAHFFGACW